jgi:hypothetical protein
MQDLGINYHLRVTVDGRLDEIVLDDLVAAVNDVLHEHLKRTEISYDTEVGQA